MDRLKLIEKLLWECTTSATTISDFMNRPRKYAADDSLYMKEVHFVMALGSRERSSMSEAAELLNVTPGAVTQMAAKLEKKGYVIRLKSSQDKRQTILSLTEKGKALCADHIAYDREEHLSVSEKLEEYSDSELEDLIRYEQRIRAIFTSDR